MNKEAAIDAQVVDICNDRQHKGSIKITLHVPAEAGALLTDILGWPTYTTPVLVALARLKQQKEETTNIVAEKPAPPQPTARAPKNPLTTKAGILSNDPLFHRYLEATHPGMKFGKTEAAAYIRTVCDVASRRDILPDTRAEKRFEFIQSSFIGWSKRDEFIEA